MSQIKNRELRSWKDVLIQLRRIETTWRGITLSVADHDTWTEAVLLCSMVLSDLSNRYVGCGTHRDHVLWAHTATSTDVSVMAAFLSDTILQLRAIREGGVTSYRDFKRPLAAKYPCSGALLAPMKQAIERFLMHPTPELLFPPYQFFSFLTHLSLVDLDMGSELEEEYIKNEELVSAHHTPPFMIARMREIMTEWFRDYSVDEISFMPKHGPGGVAELKRDACIGRKNLELRPDAIIRYVFNHRVGLDVDTYLPFQVSGVTSRTSHVVFVPKSMKTKRVISKEPTTLQYFQQGISKTVDRYIRKHPVLSKHIDLHDQLLQQELALEASRTRAFATVDLSAASDSVSYALVREVFYDTPLYPFLVALRSRTVRLPSGRELGVAKYAPMGSALCFPVETLLFACIVECTVRYVHATDGASCPVWRVYGDDIIVSDQCLTDLISNLRLCGFRINEGKTYGGTARFRESCGCDAYDGVNVTPMKIGRSFTARSVHVRSANVFQGLVDMANACHVYGFALARRYLVDRLCHETGYGPLFSQEGRGNLHSVAPTNFHLKTRWNRNYQRSEVRPALAVSETSPLGTLEWDNKKGRFLQISVLERAEESRYFEWLRQTSTRTNGDPLSDDFLPGVTIGTSGSYLAKRWVVTPS